jgi:hypothetical protein
MEKPLNGFLRISVDAANVTEHLTGAWIVQ